MKTSILWRYFVTGDGQQGVWVCAVDDAEAIQKACVKMGIAYKENAAYMHAYKIGKAGLQAPGAKGIVQ